MSRIIGPPTGTLLTVYEKCTPLVAIPGFRTDVIPILWAEAERYGIDPVGVVAQSIKETGGGTFGGKVKWKWYNPCGLKVRHQDLAPELAGDQPLAHAMFPNWETGCRAMVQHLRAYTGWPVPAEDLNVDPRYLWVAPRFVGAGLENWSELGGKWAPSPTYGTEIEALMRRLVGKAGT